MSRSLPPRPNLEFLKKEAKDRLAEVQQNNPAAQLADVLHVIARDYGFDSWPKLKAHVESLPVDTTHPLAGTWIADLDRSKQHPAHPVQSATLDIAVAGDSVTIRQNVVELPGEPMQTTTSLVVDGLERELTERYSLTATWTSRRSLEFVSRVAGEVVGRGIYEVSADGHTLTASTRRAQENADGWASDDDQRIVFNRGQ